MIVLYIDLFYSKYRNCNWCSLASYCINNQFGWQFVKYNKICFLFFLSKVYFCLIFFWRNHSNQISFEFENIFISSLQLYCLSTWQDVQYSICPDNEAPSQQCIIDRCPGEKPLCPRNGCTKEVSCQPVLYRWDF